MTDDVLRIRQPIGVTYTWSAGPGSAAYLRGLTEGKLIAGRCPTCNQVYFPPRNGICPRDGVLLTDDVEIGQAGTITTFCIVNVPFLGQSIEIPYVAASILLDGADLAVQHLIQGCPVDEVHIGMRVHAVWKPESEWQATLASIAHFEPETDPGTGGSDRIDAKATNRA